MSYKPTTWEKHQNEQGDYVYVDHRLNIVQQNLKTLHDLIDDVKTDSNINLLFIQNNINTKTIKDPTAEAIGFWVSKLIEGLGVVFTAGTPAAVIATISCKLLSGLITKVTTDKQTDAYNKVQGKVNDIKECMDEIFAQIKLALTQSVDDMEKHWNIQYDCTGSLIPDLKGKVSLSDLGDHEEFFPKKSSTDYDFSRDKLAEGSKYLCTKALLPVRWKIIKQRAFPSDGISNLIKGWNVEWYKVYNRSTWDRWRNHPEFPKIPNELSGDIEGPHTDVDNIYEDGVRKQRFMSWYQAYRDYPWTRDDTSDKWMHWSGRKSPKINDKNEVEEGLSFLDVIDDIESGIFNSQGQWYQENGLPNNPSYLLSYKTRNPIDRKESINDKRKTTLLSTDSCIDWVYDSNSIFTWGRAYRGITFNHYYLVDQDGNYANDEICKWLFKDNGHGKTVNPNAIAEKVDVYYNWGLAFYN
jgi:hypothetical protein